MNHSPLIALTRLSPHRNSPRNQPITKITIHHTAGHIGLEALGDWLGRATTRASYNYGISTDGRIGLFVCERDRSWASSSPANDHQAVTIGVANNSGAPDWRVSDTAFAALIDLCVDICRRNGIAALVYDGTPDGSLTRHNFFSNTNCPGPFLQGRFPEICRLVNERLGVSAAPAESEAPAEPETPTPPDLPDPENPTPPAPARTVTLDIFGKIQNVGGYIDKGKTWVRLTEFCEALGYRATWDEARRLPVVTHKNDSCAASSPDCSGYSPDHTVDCDDMRLLKEIVHWEARGEDEKGQILIANVVLNRMKSPHFHDTMRDVVFHPGAFTPVTNGQFGTATPGARTVAAVNRALAGIDYSQGATFFHAIRNSRGEKILTPEVWHERATRDGRLIHLFDYGNHRFYREVN